MSAMANTTLIVTTVTKTASKKKTPNGAETASRINILDFCEEHYEDILPFMDKIRRDKRREAIEGKVHSNDLATITRQARQSPGQTGNTLEMIPTVEVVLTNGTLLLAEIILEAEAIPTASKNRDPEDHVKKFQAAAQVETLGNAYVVSHVQLYSHRDYESMRLNKHVPKTLEEMMTATEAFIRGEIVAASKKKVHTPWKSQDESKRQSFERRSNFRNQPRDGRGSNKFTLLTRTPKEIFAVESGKFKPPPPMARQRQQKTGKKDAPVKDKAATIYMIQPGQRVTRQRVTQSFAYVKEITFPPLTANKGAGGDAEHYTKAWMNFMKVRSPSSYNDIIGSPEIKEIQAVPSMTHGMLKFLVNGGIVTIRSTILTPTEFTTIAATPKDHAKKAEAQIDWKVKSLCGYPFKCFMDAYKGYHQIQMAEQDEEKTAFHTSHGVYCYTKMPFGLKNAGATYQRLVDKAFDRQIGRNLEIYMDDLVIKSHTETELLHDIKVTFRTLRKINMNLILKNAFKQPKQHLAKLPMLVVLKPKEELIMYLFAFDGAISAVLMTERDTVQTPVYFLKDYADTSRRIPSWSSSTSPSSQILADFLVERPDDAPPDTSVIETPQEPWTLFTNESLCVDGSGAALILTSPKRTEFTYALSQVLRSKNKKADAMSKIVSTSFAHLSKQVLVKILNEKSIQEEELATVVEEEGPTWMTPITEYWKDETLPSNRKKASKLRIKPRPYELLEEVLYRRLHARPKFVVAKAVRLGYYWPTMHRAHEI
nr:reverse transcriptase domain-containing protein [Tanacetum cinerariifolium]